MIGQVKRLLDVIPAAGSIGGGRQTLNEAKLAALLAAARVAPSADNAQTWRFITLQDELTKARLVEAIDPPLHAHFAASNTILVLCGVQWVVTRVRREQPFVFMDAPIALMHILLQAAEFELRYVWTMQVDEKRARDALGIPASVRVVALIGVS